MSSEYSRVPVRDPEELEAAGSSAAPPAVSQHPLKVLGLNMSSWSPKAQFFSLTLLIIFFFEICSLIEEALFRNYKDFTYGVFMALFELIFFTAVAVMRRKQVGEQPWEHSAPLSSHALIAFFMAAGRSMTNMALPLLNYPTLVIFKNGKLVSTMIVSFLWLGKKPIGLRYLSAVALILSAILFSLGDVDVSPVFNPTGTWLITISLLFDGLHSVSQEAIMNRGRASRFEMLVFTNAFSAVIAFFFALPYELFPALGFCLEHPEVVFFLCLRSLVIYCGVECFTTIVKEFGAVLANIVTTVRKISTVILSFLVFPKPFSINYAFAMLLFGCGVAVESRIMSSSSQVKAAAAASTGSPDSSSRSVKKEKAQDV